jgi:predicted permease
MPAFWRRRTHEDFGEEVRAHLELETERLIGEGLSPDAARRAARKAFGNVVAVTERFHEASRWFWLEQLSQDLRYAWRGMVKSPSFLATSVLTLAIGLALVTVAFTIFNAYVLRPFAVEDPASLHRIGWRTRDGGGQAFRWRDYQELRERRDLFDASVAEDMRFVSSNGRPLSTALVSENYFEALRPRVLLGRPLAAIDAGAPVIVLSYQAWQRLYAGDPGALGREVEIDGRPFAIVGVIGPAFAGLDEYPRDAWVPITSYAEGRPGLLGAGEPARLEITARLRTDVNLAHAESALTPFMARMSDRASDAGGVRAHIRPSATPNPLSLELLAVLSPVFAAFGLVLAAACANVSNVMLARAIARRREIGVRLALGASRGRVVRQLLTEGLLIAVLAGVAGLALAAWALRAGLVALFSTLPPSMASLLRVVPMDFDARVFLFALGVAAATTLVFALLPALQASRLSLTDALRGQRSGTVAGSRLRSALVMGQVAVSLVLVVGALTLARNFTALAATDLGYRTEGVYSVNVRGEQTGLVPRLAEALAADSRIAEVAVTGGNPLFIRSRAVAASAGGGTAPAGTRYTFVSPEYFSILRMPIVRGRAFRPDESRASARVAIVSEATGRAFWPGANPVGQIITIERPEGRPVDELPGYAEVIVVGTTRDVVSGMLFDGRDAGHIYLPTHPADPHAIAVLVRPRAEGAIGPDSALQQIFRRVSSTPEVFEAVPLDDMRRVQIYPLRAAAWIGLLLGAIALVLSVSGLYGVLTYTMNQRTREIGIRMALGATAGAVVALVMRQSARLAGAGAIAGLVFSFGAMKALSAAIQLQSVSLLQVVPFAGGVTLVLAATAAAAFQPARRATRVDPAETLRAEA